MTLYFKSAANSMSWFRYALSSLIFFSSSLACACWSYSIRPRSSVYFFINGWSRSSISWISPFTALSRSFAEASLSRSSAFCSIYNCRRRRYSSSISAGRDDKVTRTLAQASSMRSMALSGKKRLVMYLAASCVATTTALSVICTPWCCS